MENVLTIFNSGKVDPISIAGNKYLLDVDKAIKEELDIKCLFLNNIKYRGQDLYLINEDIYRLTKRETYTSTQWIELKKLNRDQISRIKINENEIDDNEIIKIITNKRGC